MMLRSNSEWKPVALKEYVDLKVSENLLKSMPNVKTMQMSKFITSLAYDVPLFWYDTNAIIGNVTYLKIPVIIL